VYQAAKIFFLGQPFTLLSTEYMPASFKQPEPLAVTDKDLKYIVLLLMQETLYAGMLQDWYLVCKMCLRKNVFSIGCAADAGDAARGHAPRLVCIYIGRERERERALERVCVFVCI
jgi:hypothetical protein